MKSTDWSPCNYNNTVHRILTDKKRFFIFPCGSLTGSHTTCTELGSHTTKTCYVIVPQDFLCCNSTPCSSFCHGIWFLDLCLHSHSVVSFSPEKCNGFIVQSESTAGLICFSFETKEGWAEISGKTRDDDDVSLAWHAASLSCLDSGSLIQLNHEQRILVISSPFSSSNPYIILDFVFILPQRCCH